MPKSQSKWLFYIVLVAVIAFSIWVVFLGVPLRELTTIPLIFPLIWGYMILSLRGAIAVGLIISFTRFLIGFLYAETLTPGNVDVLQVATNAFIVILLYIGLAIPIAIYRRKQTNLIKQLGDANTQEMRDRVASSLVHDFGNILTVITGTSELLAKDKTLSLQSAKDVNTIHNASKQATTLIHQMSQNFPKGTSQKPDYQLCELSDIVSRQIDVISRMLEPDIKIDFVPSQLPLMVRLDVQQILRLLLNLCMNAKRAMNGKGTITITTSAQYPNGKPMAQLVVKDTGIGIPPETLQHIFEQFYTTAPDTGRAGLGLSIVQSIVTNHGGKIHVNSSSGAGAEFVITLPMSEQSM